MDCWRSKQENFLRRATFLFDEDDENVENTGNLARMGKNWNEFNFQARKIDLSHKIRPAIEIIGVEI